MWEQASNRQTDPPAERHFPVCIQQMHLFWKMPSQGSAGGSRSMFMFQRKSLCRIHSRAAHTAGQQHLESRHCWAGSSPREPCVPTLCPHSLSPLPLIVLCPQSTSQLCVLVLCPSCMSQPCAPAPCSCPASLSHVPVLCPCPCRSPADTGDSSRLLQSRGGIRVPAPCAILDNAEPCRAMPDLPGQRGQTGSASGGARPEPAPLGRIQEPIYMQMSLLIKDKRRNEQKPPSTRAEAFSPDAFQSC